MGSFEGFAAGEVLPFAGIGTLLAALLIVGLRFGLPPSELRRIRVPLLLLLGHLLLVATVAMLDESSSAHRVLSLAGLLLLLIALGRAGFLLVVDAILVRRLSRRIPRIFRDICEGLVYMAAVLVVLRQAGAQLDALLTTSALLTAVIGLSLQDTLGNLFAGLSIQAQNPFEVGDWIQYNEDPDMVGRVVEINWRATKVITLDRVEIVIPNGPLARAPIRNYTKPTPITRRSLFVVIPFHVPPHDVREVIEKGVEGTAGILARPAPSVVTKSFEERGILYWIRFFTDDYERREVIDGRVRDRVWYSLRRAGIEFAVPVADIDVVQDDESHRRRQREEAYASRRQALQKVDVLAALPEEELDKLASLAQERPYAPGEVVIREGDSGDELFIVLEGDLSVRIGKGASEVEVAQLHAGSFFGEMSLMTGAPRTASVRCSSDARLLVIDKQGFSRVLEASPELAETISAVLAARKQELDSASSKSAGPTVDPRRALEERGELLKRIKQFFSL